MPITSSSVGEPEVSAPSAGQLTDQPLAPPLDPPLAPSLNHPSSQFEVSNRFKERFTSEELTESGMTMKQARACGDAANEIGMVMEKAVVKLEELGVSLAKASCIKQELIQYPVDASDLPKLNKKVQYHYNRILNVDYWASQLTNNPMNILDDRRFVADFQVDVDRWRPLLNTFELQMPAFFALVLSLCLFYGIVGLKSPDSMNWIERTIWLVSVLIGTFNVIVVISNKGIRIWLTEVIGKWESLLLNFLANGYQSSPIVDRMERLNDLMYNQSKRMDDEDPPRRVQVFICQLFCFIGYLVKFSVYSVWLGLSSLLCALRYIAELSPEDPLGDIEKQGGIAGAANTPQSHPNVTKEGVVVSTQQ